MEDRLDDLFVLDAEQAARELLVYGDGRSDLPVSRLAGTADYLAPLLQSCGLLRLAEACQLFQVLFEVGDEAQIRRSVREFAELTLHALESLKAGTPSTDRAIDVDLEKLIVRLQQSSPGASQASHQPSAPSRFRQVESQQLDPDRDLIANAFRAIEAVDSLAVLIAKEAQGHNDGPSTTALENVPVSEEACRVFDSTTFEGDSSFEPLQPPIEAADASSQIASNANLLQHLSSFSLRRAVSSFQIDAAFRKALRLSNDEPWPQGMATLLESIDVLDHVDLREALPLGLSLLGVNEVLVHAKLVHILAQELTELQVAGLGDAMLVSQTLIFAIQLDRLVPHERLAKQVASQGGRIEIDTSLRRWRIVVPASTRLIRIIQLKVDGSWIAVPWAQFLGIDGRPPRQEVQLCIGDESDRVRADEIGLVSTGVRFELSKGLLRRERYRGLVMLANAECLPVYA